MKEDVIMKTFLRFTMCLLSGVVGMLAGNVYVTTKQKYASTHKD